ncbi:hypothetical protein CAPTEDRAFT_172501 [Capitella teleta]|uniref:Cytochrome P450 n=1 Tax=Capitella teleta TaxID=283909 RepID=R7TBI8_CAPTE|nr:hypothetical protein CAPTEDRAFT_172501 [Capitella teleta]|eukprot:ELT88466.1 hypothetical protein CAPTEDRAFT_172501 [Capitella teleta]
MFFYILLTLLLAVLAIKVIERQAEYLYRRFPSPGRSMPVVGHLHILGRDKLHSSLTTWISKLGDLYSVHIFTRRFIVLANFEAIRHLIVGKKLTFKERYDMRCVNLDSRPAIITDSSSQLIEAFGKEIALAKGFGFSPDAAICRTVMSTLCSAVDNGQVDTFIAFIDLMRVSDATRWELCPFWLKLAWFPIYREQWNFEKSIRALELKKTFKDSKNLHASCVLHNVFATFISAMLHHTDLQKAIRQEIRTSLKADAPVKPEHKVDMRYAHAIVYEVLRLSPPTPLLSATISTDNASIGNLPLHKGTRVLINNLANHIDWNSWSEPGEFWPERFLDPDTNAMLPGDDPSVVRLKALLEMQLKASIRVDDLIDAVFLFGTNLVRNFLLEPEHRAPLPPLNPFVKQTASLSVAPAFKLRMTAL